MERCLWLTAVVASIVLTVNGQTYENKVQLKSNLLTNYDPDIVPRNNQSEALIVSVQLYIYGIVEIDSVEGNLKVTASLNSAWTDERLTWNSSDYGGITSIKLLQDTVWTPIIALLSPLQMTSIGQKWMGVRYQSNGAAYWKPYDVFEMACPFNNRYWPFDKNICYLAFFTYDEIANEVLLTTTKDTVDFRFFVPNAEWCLESSYTFSVVHENGLSQISYGLKLPRQATFYALTIILPLVALNLANSLVFLLPHESGERIGYTVTLLLSIIVFLILIGDHVPKTSEPTPLICGYLTFIVILSLLCLLVVILNEAVYFHEGEVPPASWVRKLTSLASHSTEKQNHHDSETHHGEVRHVMFKNKVEPEKATEEFEVKSKSVLADHEDVSIVTWKDVSKSLDWIALIFFLFTSTLASCFFPIYLSVASHYPHEFTG